MSIEPSMTTDEWLKGANKPRKDLDMETLFKGTSVAAPAKRSSRLGRSTAASTAPANSQPKAEPNAAPGESLFSFFGIFLFISMSTVKQIEFLLG